MNVPQPNKPGIKEHLAKAYKDKITALREKHPSELTADDRAEISALRSYFQPHELKAFGIEPEEAVKKPTKTKEE